MRLFIILHISEYAVLREYIQLYQVTGIISLKFLNAKLSKPKSYTIQGNVAMYIIYDVVCIYYPRGPTPL